MSVQASDLVFYNAVDMPVVDGSTLGGAIDALRRPTYTQISSAEKIDVTSTASGDTSQTVTLTGRLADGSLATETLSLNGTTVVTSTNTYERLLKYELSATATGTVTGTGHTSTTVFVSVPAGERGVQAIFQQDPSSPSAGVDYYSKVFIKNTNGSLALTVATVTENSDPSGDITLGVAATLNDSATTTNRQTAPGGITFNNGPQNVANSQNLSSGAAQGVWLELTLAIGNAAIRSTYTLEIDGQSV